MQLFDSHAHYNDDRLDAEYPGGAAQAIEDARNIGVCAILNAGTNPETSAQSIAQSFRSIFIFSGEGAFSRLRCLPGYPRRHSCPR